MGILDDLEPNRRQYTCKVQLLAEGLEEADRTKFYEAIDNPNWSSASLSEALTKRGLPISRYPIDKHRKKVCQCSKI